MKLNQIFENVAAGAVSTGAIATTGGGFSANRLIRRNKNKKRIGDVQLIKYHHENNWNVR